MTTTTTANLIRARKTVLERREPVHALFAAVDNKGRRFGARARLEVVEWAAASAEHDFAYLIPAERLGVWFHVLPHATRDAVDYGAWHAGQSFRTEALAQAYIARYFAEAEKRALKNKARAA